MTKKMLACFAVILSLFFTASAHAEAPNSHLSQDDAIKIISTLERINPRHYQVIHIADGTQRDKDGFQHDHAKKISFYGPKKHKRHVSLPKAQHDALLCRIWLVFTKERS